ncbi:GNAT family N-acetyltransferase [Pseudomonas sp. NA-150]|uniref:GNAT family N-acetyltransferase n=1 Tax=Pseudomonas sp. NA-150 TaxID=3367525 RepID=UPI0037C9A9AE
MLSIELHAAHQEDLQSIENLMQFYMHDFSEWLPLKLSDHGFFSVQSMQNYWRKPATQPFLIKVDGELAGFVTVDGDGPFTDAHYNIGYFFISRRFRGRGIARFVVSALLSKFPGQWQIFHIDANQPARGFWEKIISELTQGAFSCHPVTVDGYPCTLYRFESVAG